VGRGEAKHSDSGYSDDLPPTQSASVDNYDPILTTTAIIAQQHQTILSQRITKIAAAAHEVISP
jgi:hypothetical protein